jgi:hypothetical protein
MVGEILQLIPKISNSLTPKLQKWLALILLNLYRKRKKQKSVGSYSGVIKIGNNASYLKTVRCMLGL